MGLQKNLESRLKPYSDREHLGVCDNAIYLDPPKKRFELVAGIVGGDVLDVGCGFGTLKTYLKEGTAYTGIDATEWVANAGQNIHCDVMDYTPVDKHDWVVALGVVETCTDLKALADKLKSLAKIGVMVSFHTYCDKPFTAYSQQDMENAFGNGEITHIGHNDFMMVIGKEI